MIEGKQVYNLSKYKRAKSKETLRSVYRKDYLLAFLFTLYSQFLV